MDNSIYIGLSRQMALFRDMNATANNIANAATPGYNAEKMMFTHYLVDDGNRHKMAFNQDISTYRDTHNGPIKQTGNPFDVAINGPGYFAVETPLGVRYTKAGHFNLDNEGQLVNPEGHIVLDQGQQAVAFEITDRDVEIGENGLITVKTPAGEREVRGQLGLFEFEDEQRMDRLSAQLYDTEQEPLEAIESRMIQGAIEQSNVSAVKELVRITELSRSNTGTAKFIEVMYDLQRKASNAYARESNK
ncbi:MAG: flagellar basal-body rod protein FlgF [Rickettsiales bacterium]|nr:flagellar basal-body rod protein FlgF [Rickettsiales bacterium]